MVKKYQEALERAKICGDVYMKFWNDVETISCRKHCDECGQALDWSDNNE